VDQLQNGGGGGCGKLPFDMRGKRARFKSRWDCSNGPTEIESWKPVAGLTPSDIELFDSVVALVAQAAPHHGRRLDLKAGKPVGASFGAIMKLAKNALTEVQGTCLDFYARTWRNATLNPLGGCGAKIICRDGRVPRGNA